MRLTKRTNLSVTILLLLFGLTCILVLPGLPVGRAATTPNPTGQKASSSGLDGSRQAAMEKLYAQFKAGAPFSEEEGVILRKFGVGGTLTDLEADVVISRALYDYYIAAKALSKEQEELLGRYTRPVARRTTAVADLKTQLLNKRKAAAAAAPPRTTPLSQLTYWTGAGRSRPCFMRQPSAILPWANYGNAHRKARSMKSRPEKFLQGSTV